MVSCFFARQVNFTLFDAEYFRISIDTQALFWDAVKVLGKSLIFLGLAFKNLVGAEQHLALALYSTLLTEDDRGVPYTVAMNYNAFLPCCGDERSSL